MCLVFAVIPSEVEESRCKTQSYFHGVLRLRFAPLRMTALLITSQIELASYRLRKIP